MKGQSKHKKVLGVRRAYPLRLSLAFTVLELFYNPVSCRKLIVKQVILFPRNEDELCPSGDALDH